MPLNIFDSEWQDWKARDHIRSIYPQLISYRKFNHKFPNSLNDIGINEKWCYFFKCFTFKYQAGDNNQNFTIATKVNDPFVAFFSYNCPSGGGKIDDDHKTLCAQIGLKEDYNGPTSDLPIYRKTTKFFPNPNDWPEL